MFSRVLSCALKGIDGYPVDVEIDIGQGLPSFEIVGLPDSAVKESKERVRSAIKNSGFEFPLKRIIINLAPADTRKEGPSFDLPIAVAILTRRKLQNFYLINHFFHFLVVAILTTMGVISKDKVADYMFMGELSLDGCIRGVNGVLPMVYCGYKNGVKNFAVPSENAREASLVESTQIHPFKSLKELCEHFNNKTVIPSALTEMGF